MLTTGRDPPERSEGPENPVVGATEPRSEAAWSYRTSKRREISNRARASAGGRAGSDWQASRSRSPDHHLVCEFFSQALRPAVEEAWREAASAGVDADVAGVVSVGAVSVAAAATQEAAITVVEVVALAVILAAVRCCCRGGQELVDLCS
eukprot:1271396-Rhodomonas_salina.2